MTPTPQTLDPLGGLTARYFLLVTAFVAALIAGLALWEHAEDILRPEWQIAALGALVAALVQAIVAADPRFFPFGRIRHAAVFAMLLLATALDAASRPAGSGQDGAWGAVTIAILLFMSGSFRPWLEIIVVSVLTATGVGIIVGLHLGDLGAADSAELVIRSVTPVLAVGAGTAAFSHVLVTRVSAWQRHNQVVPPADPAAAAEVQRWRQDFVDYRVGPFLEGLLESDTITPVDIARARGLSAALRQQMLRDAERSWLDDAVDSFEGDRSVVDEMTAWRWSEPRAGEPRGSSGCVARAGGHVGGDGRGPPGPGIRVPRRAGSRVPPSAGGCGGQRTDDRGAVLAIGGSAAGIRVAE